MELRLPLEVSPGRVLGATAFIYILGTVADWLIDRAMAITRLDRLLKLPDRLIDRI